MVFQSVVGCVGLVFKGTKRSSRTRPVVQLLALVLVSLISQRSLSAQLVQSNGKVIFTPPATNVGASSGPQNLLLKTTSAVSITSFTVPLSQGSKQEYAVGTVTGCTVDGSTVNPSGTTCTVPITFTPAYPGTRAVPLHIVTSGGNVNIGLAGSGVSPLTSITPGVVLTIAGDVNASGCDAYNGPATQGPQCNPSGVAVDAVGNVYIVSFYSNTVSKIDPSGNVTVIAGTGAGGISGVNGPATEANIERPADVVIDPAGNVYFADESAQQVFRIDAITQILTSVAGNGTEGYSGDNGPATAAEVNRPEGVALDLQGNLYIEDQDNNIIRKVDTAGVITTVAGDPSTAGNGDPTYGGDGGPAIKAGLALCCSGVAASYDSIGIDASGNLFIGDSGHHVIRKVTTDGIIHTVAGNNALGAGFSGDGGVATSAQLNEPMGVAVDAAGDIYIADFFNNRIRKVDAATQVISTVAGNGIGTFAGDGGPATLASLNGPQKVELDGLGNLYIGDTKNNLVRKVTVGGPTLTFVTPTLDGTTDTTDGPLGVIVSDIGNAPLTLDKPGSGSNPTISSNFSLFTGETGACPTLTSSSASATIAEGASCALDVDFTPLATGSLTGSLVLTDNSMNAPANMDTISLAGMGTGPTASFSPTSLSFPSTTLTTTTAAMTTKLSNTGTATLNIAGITITGTNASNFAETSTCAATLAADSNCIVSVTFTPTAPGAAAATLSLADDAAHSPQTVALSGTGAAVPSSVTETGNLWFNPAPVAIASASAQTLTATFTITGYSSLITPTAKMNYGLAYTAGKVTCTGTTGSQICTVPVTFIPNYPGGRRDALFLLNGTTRLASQLAYGIGQSAFSLIQPGVVTNPAPSSTNTHYTSVTGEDGALYQLEDQSNAVEAITSAGVNTVLPITGLNSPRGIGIDGAGILYIVDQTTNGSFTTYDTVLKLQGSIPFPTAGDFQTLAVGNEGTFYAYGGSGNGIYAIPPTGAATLTALNPSITQPGAMTVDSAENVFVGGYTINEITPGGVQTQINTVGSGDGLSSDAAGTVYATRYTGVNGIAMLAASNFSQPETSVDTVEGLGTSVGPDATVYVGNYGTIDKVDRSQGTISFGEQSAGTAATSQTIQIYNGGNETLTLSNIVVSGEGFTVQASSTDNCAKSGTIAAGALCNLTVGFLPTHAGTFSGTVTIGSNSLNNTATTQTVALSGFVYGVYVQATPNPLAFGSQTVNTTSSPLTVTFTNNGDLYSAGINGFTSTDPAFVVTPSAAGCSNVGVGSSCTATVTFAPTDAKAYSSTIGFSASSSGGGTNQSGSFTATGTGAGGVTVSPSSIAFGNEEEYTENYQAQKVTVTNNGSATLTFGTLVFSPNFVLYQDDCGPQLLGNSSCYYLVSFYPKGVGSFTGNVSIPFTGSTGSPLTVSFTGTGTVATPAIALDPVPVNFGTVAVGTSATPISVNVENTGYAPLTGITAAISGADADEYSQTNNCAGVEIDPYGGSGGACQVTINFLAATGGPQTATLTVTSNGGAATTTTTLSAGVQAKPAQIQFSPTQLNLVAGTGSACADATAGGLATAATLCNITGTAQDYLGNTYLVDNTYNAVYKVDTTGKISIFAGTPSKTGGHTGDSGPATSATLSGPTSVAADAFGDIFIADTANQAIRIVDPTGIINIFVDPQCDAGVKGTPKHLSAGAPAGKGHRHSLDLCGTLQPEGLVVDSSGNLIWADTFNDAVFETNITTGGFTIVAGKTSGGTGTAGYNGDNILADGAELNAPQDVAVDAAGNIYIADTINYRIRKVTLSTGIITTVAGNGTQGDTGDGSAATSATINPYGVSANLAGDLFITPGTGGPGTGSIVRKVDATGNIDVFAGNGTGALGGPASTGAVANAYFARIDNNGDLLIPGGLQVLEAGPDGLLQFGSESVGSTSAALSATVESTGGSNLSILSVGPSITGPNAADFALAGDNCGTGEIPGQTCALQVTFKPSATGARTATLNVPTNAAGSPQTVLLQGNGSTASAPVASLSPTALNFPNTAVGSTATALSTTLSNTGNAVLNISGITLTGANLADFAETTTCGTTLAAGTACTISATFTPAAVASYTASISVADDATGSPQTVTLSGAGTAAPAPVASLSPTALIFPSTTVGTTATAIATTLSNTGNAALSITGITLAGANPADFAETTTCGTTLAAGATCTISVTFTPASATSFAATVSVADNAAGSPQTATLAATGLTPPVTDFTLTVTPPTQTVKAGGATAYTVQTAGIGGDFDGAVSLTVTGLPSGATATFSPASVTPGANGANSLLSIQTLSPLALAQPTPLHRTPQAPWLPQASRLPQASMLAALLAVPLLGLRRRFRKLRIVSCVLVLLATLTPMALLAGCGGGYFAEQTQTYTVTVTGTSGSIHHSTTVTLTVQQ